MGEPLPKGQSAFEFRRYGRRRTDGVGVVVHIRGRHGSFRSREERESWAMQQRAYFLLYSLCIDNPEQFKMCLETERPPACDILQDEYFFYVVFEKQHYPFSV